MDSSEGFSASGKCRKEDLDTTSTTQLPLCNNEAKLQLEERQLWGKECCTLLPASMRAKGLRAESQTVISKVPLRKGNKMG